MTKLQEFIEIANKEYDGHCSIFKFTGGWRCCFDTVNERMKSYYMAYGETMDEAIDKCIKNRIDIDKIDAKIKTEDILNADLETRINYGTKYMSYIKPTEYNHYSKRLYRFLNVYPDYRFVQIFENAKSLKEAIFTLDPMYLFRDAPSSINGENELKNGEYIEGYSLETIIKPKMQFTKKKFRADTEPCIVKNISFEFWENYILHGEDYFSKELTN